MSYSSGTFSLVAGNPVVTGTTVSSTWANNTLSDIATALSTCLLKDGTQTATASVDFAQGLTVATNKLTVDPATGNTAVAGTFAATGASTLTGAVYKTSTDGATLDATPRTVYTLTADVHAVYLITASCTETSANYSVGIVVTTTANSRLYVNIIGANITFSLSGADIQWVAPGGALTSRFTILRLR